MSEDPEQFKKGVRRKQSGLKRKLLDSSLVYLSEVNANEKGKLLLMEE